MLLQEAVAVAVAAVAAGASAATAVIAPSVASGRTADLGRPVKTARAAATDPREIAREESSAAAGAVAVAAVEGAVASAAMASADAAEAVAVSCC